MRDRAPQELNTTTKPYERITLLVNVWLEHHPGGLVPFPATMATEMGYGTSREWFECSTQRCSKLGLRNIDRSDTRWHPPLTRDLSVGGSMQLKVSFPDPNKLWREDEVCLLRIEVPEGDGVTHHNTQTHPNQTYLPL